MAQEEGKIRTGKVSFHAALRFVVIVHLTTTLTILAFLFASTLYSSSATDELGRLTGAASACADIRDLFNMSDRSLRAFVDSGGDIDTIGNYASSELAMPVLVARVRDEAAGGVRQRITLWFRSYLAYADDYREPIVDLVQDRKLIPARRLILGDQGREGFQRLFDEASRIAAVAENDRASARSGVNRLQLITLIVTVALASLLLAFDVVLFVLARREFTRPLIGLADAARKVGHGDFSSHAAGSNVAEIDVVSRSFNTMSGEIRRRMQELRRATVDRADFVSSVSHELRTPVTSLLGYLEMLSAGEAGELTEEQRTYVTVAERNARQLDTLIGDLLMLSGLEHEDLPLKVEPTDVSQLILALKAEMLPIAREKQIDLVVVQTGDLIAEVDSVRIRQALANLVSNAIKYSEPGQAVVIRVFREGENMAIGVVDWGPGIAPDELTMIAEPFYRSTRHSDVPGTGIGLAIAKQMAELHGGRLRVESELGTGSTFTLVIPCK